MRHHHLHQFDDYHYGVDNHDGYPNHHHEWSGNNHFDTCLDVVDDHCADDHELVTGDDFYHPGFDVHFS